MKSKICLQTCLLVLISLAQAHSTSECPNLEEDIYFIGNPEDIDYISNCTSLNSSLFITGDYNIQNLDGLTNLESIEGYLVILDSHLIRNLKGLHNLKEVKGKEKYLKTAGVTFKYNNNFMNDENRGLCFTNLVNWNYITADDLVDNNNGLDCPDSCHEECLGCFGPGPRLCQECKNHKVGNTCVSYDCDSENCDLKPPQEPATLTFNRTELYNLEVSWNYLNISAAGGNILEYLLFRDGNLISHTYFNDSGYDTLDVLPTFYLDTELPLDLHYTYQITYVTEYGSQASDNYTYNMYDWRPDNITQLQIVEYDISAMDSVNTKISFNCETNGVPYSFLITVFREGLQIGSEYNLPVISDNNFNLATVTDLVYETSYEIVVCAINNEYNIKGVCASLDFNTPLTPTSTTTSTSTSTSSTTTSLTSQTTTSSSMTTTTSSTSNTHTSTSSTSNTHTSTSSTSNTHTSTTETDTTTTQTSSTLTGTTLTTTSTSSTLTNSDTKTSMTVTNTETRSTLTTSDTETSMTLTTNETSSTLTNSDTETSMTPTTTSKSSTVTKTSMTLTTKETTSTSQTPNITNILLLPNEETNIDEDLKTTSTSTHTNTHTTTHTNTSVPNTTPDILLLVNNELSNQNDTNHTNHTTPEAKNYRHHSPLFLWLLLGITILSSCIGLGCCLCQHNDNDIHPFEASQGYANPVYQRKTSLKKVSTVVTDEFQYQNGNNNVTGSASTPGTVNQHAKNPLYNSGSSIASNTENHYDVVERKILQNTTYGEVRPVERVIIPNETYGFPENQVTKFEASDTDESVGGETLTESKNQDNIEVRPSSAYREINRNNNNNSRFSIQELAEGKTGLKKYRPTMRREITDESISRRKGNLLTELSKKLPDKKE